MTFAYTESWRRQSKRRQPDVNCGWYMTGSLWRTYGAKKRPVERSTVSGSVSAVEVSKETKNRENEKNTKFKGKK